jgi:hypothetical protein
MKTRLILGLMLLVLARARPAHADLILTFDEKGAGFVLDTATGSSTTMSSALITDPVSGLTTIAYQLPFAPVIGDVLITEPAGGMTGNSDLLRFSSILFTRMFVFSEGPDPGEVPDPADVGVPAPAIPLATVTITEVGTEASNGVIYTPAVGGPGFSPLRVTYAFVSDPPIVPEPGVMTLLAFGSVIGGLPAFRHWSRGRRRAA